MLQQFDPDILFNDGHWRDLIATQEPLFSINRLVEISDQLRGEFHAGHAAGRDMPKIARANWRTSLLDRYAEVEIGYDLPCLISAARPSRGRIVMCAQDPLRRGNTSGVTVGTFFGIDNPHYRARRHWRMIWQLVRSCVEVGYDVWVTDAIKVFAGRNVLRTDKALRELCFSVLQDEIRAVRPDKILAFGNVAKQALNASDIGSFIALSHPTARGIRGSMADRLAGYQSALGI